MVSETYIKDIKYLEEKIQLIEYIEHICKTEDFVKTSFDDDNIAPWETSEIKSLDYFSASLLSIKKQAKEVYSRDKLSYGITIRERQLLNDITCIQFDIDQYFRLKGNKILNQIYMQKYQKQLDDIVATINKSTISEINEQLDKFLNNCNKSKLSSFTKSTLYSRVLYIVLKTIEMEISKNDIKQIDLSLIKKYALEEELLHYIKSSIIEKAMAEEKFDKFTIIEVLDKLNIDDLENPEFWSKFFGIDNAEILVAKSVEDITDTTELSSTDNEIISLSSLQSSLSSTEKLYKLFKKLRNSNIKYRIGIVCRDSINGDKKYKSVKIPFTFSKFKKLIKDCDTLYTFATINEDTGEYENLEMEFGKLENFEITPKKEQIMKVETNYYHIYQEFSSCKNLRKIVLLDNVMQINDFAFFDCYNLTHVILGNRIQSIGRRCFSKTAIEEINIPDNTEILGNHAFGDCSNLRIVHLGNGIKSIGKNCFSNTSLDEINIPDNFDIDEKFILYVFGDPFLFIEPAKTYYTGIYPKKIYTSNNHLKETSITIKKGIYNGPILLCSAIIGEIEIDNKIIPNRAICSIKDSITAVPIDEKDRAAEVVSKDIANCVNKEQEIC